MVEKMINQQGSHSGLVLDKRLLQVLITSNLDLYLKD